MSRPPLALALLLSILFLTPARAADPQPPFPFTKLILQYYVQDKSQPPLDDLLKTAIPLDVVNGVYTAPAPGHHPTPIPLEKLGTGDVQKIDASAIKALYQHLVAALTERHLIGNFVTIDAKDIDEHDRDIRTDHTSLTIIIITSRIVEMRTIRFVPGQRNALVNNPADAPILKNAPLHTVADGGPDLLNKQALDAYTRKLAGTGINVQCAVSSSPTGVGDVILDFLIGAPPASQPATDPAPPPP
ncbi:MAG TPA: hypothetical protein VHQ47_00995 [Phycisphaerae bacterium]|nr:hypothetical protein [Phycisphaerae bacterium]